MHIYYHDPSTAVLGVQTVLTQRSRTIWWWRYQLESGAVSMEQEISIEAIRANQLEESA